jgi:hypothetical protein
LIELMTLVRAFINFKSNLKMLLSFWIRVAKVLIFVKAFLCCFLKLEGAFNMFNTFLQKYWF